MAAKLNVNIDHVATIREARKTIEPSVLDAAAICESAGAHGITVHLRGDRRHIQDTDVEQLKETVTTYLNLEIAASAEMIGIASRIRPDAVSLVAEDPNEITTEGGLNVIDNFDHVRGAVEALRSAGIFVSIFIDPVAEQLDAAKRAGADQVELCTAEYAELTLDGSTGLDVENEIERLANAARHAHSIGLIVAAGHGLTTANVVPLAAMSEIVEFNIGHHIISRSIFVGLETAVKEMLDAIA